MSEAVCRCISCWKYLKGKDELWQVRRIENLNGRYVEVVSPTCSEKCAKAAQEENAKIFRHYLDVIEKQHFNKANVNYHLGIEE